MEKKSTYLSLTLIQSTRKLVWMAFELILQLIHNSLDSHQMPLFRIAGIIEGH